MNICLYVERGKGSKAVVIFRCLFCLSCFTNVFSPGQANGRGERFYGRELPLPTRRFDVDGATGAFSICAFHLNCFVASNIL